MAKYAAEHGNKAAATKSSRELEHNVNESTIRIIKSAYLRKLGSEKVLLPYRMDLLVDPFFLGKLWTLR